VPRCLGGTDLLENLTVLTFREHYLAHWLLTKLVNDARSRVKVSAAFYLMSKSNNGLRETNSHRYDRAKRHNARARREFEKTPEGKIFLATRLKKRLDKMAPRFTFHFYHEKFGDFKIPSWDLAARFPDERLVSANLTKVGQGLRQSHKGWILFKNREIGIGGLTSIRRQKMSVSAKKRFKNSDEIEKMRNRSRISGKTACLGYKKFTDSGGSHRRAIPDSNRAKKLELSGFVMTGDKIRDKAVFFENNR